MTADLVARLRGIIAAKPPHVTVLAGPRFQDDCGGVMSLVQRLIDAANHDGDECEWPALAGLLHDAASELREANGRLSAIGNILSARDPNPVGAEIVTVKRGGFGSGRLAGESVEDYLLRSDKKQSDDR